MKNLVLISIFMVALTGCADLTTTQQRVLTAGAVGVAGGAVVGAIAGEAALGALTGAGAGALSGYLWDQHKKSEHRAYLRGYQQGKNPPRTKTYPYR